MSTLPKDTIKVVGESIGLTDLSNEVANGALIIDFAMFCLMLD
jgi:hypothetical protein